LIPLNLIDLDDDTNGRAETRPDKVHALALSIRSIGLLNPITLRPTGQRYTLVAGLHRLLAFRELGHPTIPATLHTFSTAQTLTARLCENATRTNLSPLEEAHQLAAILDETPGGIEPIAALTGRSVDWILNRLDILSWPDSLRAAVHHAKIPLSAARTLARITDPATLDARVAQAVNHGISARTAHLWLQDFQSQGPPTENTSPLSTLEHLHAQPLHTTVDCFACHKPTEINATTTIRFCPGCLFALSQVIQHVPDLANTQTPPTP
jgi:ParB family chromosome partitioning protein